MNKEIESLERKNRITWYGVVIGLVSAVGQHGIYLLGHKLSLIIGNEAFVPKIPVIDDLFIVVPAFIIPYVWAYIYWAMTPMVASKCETRHYCDYLAAYLFACLTGMIVLAIFPTCMDRVAEGLYLPREGACAKLMMFWYSLDGSERAYNLLPSFHCINSTVSYLAVRGRKEIPKWYRTYSLIITLLIFVATMFVKQHYILDVVSGAAIGVVSFALCKKFHAGRVFLKLVER